jgi:hypothetical protein
MSNSTGAGAAIFVAVVLAFLGYLIFGGIRSCTSQDSFTAAENHPMTMADEGIVSHSWASVRTCPGSFNGPCPRGGGFQQWLHILLRNTSSENHTVVLCGDEVRTKDDSAPSIGVVCVRLKLQPDSKLRKTLHRFSSLQGGIVGFQVVENPTVVGIDAHPVAPLGACADDGTKWFCTYRDQSVNGY